MSRIVSVWLPRWPILRFLATQTKKTKKTKTPSDKPVDPDRPFVLAVPAAGGPHIAALNEAAEATGLALGEPLADARAKAGFLQVRGIDAAADIAALHRLTLWTTRYTPTASPYDEENGADGFFLDIEGAAHLFGGEERLLADLAARLEKNFGLPARLAVAATPGAAWAASHFHPAPSPILPRETGEDEGCLSPYVILPTGREAEALAPLPVEALRLAPETCATLRRLGFKTVGALIDQPRAPFAARFSAKLLRRLDQALGRAEEPLAPIASPPVYHTLRYLLEPIVTQEAVVALSSRLMGTLAHVLTRDGAGARALKLALYRVDGEVKTLDIALTLPTRSAAHVVRMIELKLDAAAATEDAGFGFEAVGLAVTRVEPMPARQIELPSAAGDADRTERCAALVDTLCQRLGRHSVRQFHPVARHLPEQAEALANVNGAVSPLSKGGNDWPELERERPLLLLPQAEPVEDVTALVPDGPPRRFCWRGVNHEVTAAQGPERIGAEWWRNRTQSQALTRDYYLVEDSGGCRFWLFRAGLYGCETKAARWFMHGLFA
jgi:protein ImuB